MIVVRYADDIVVGFQHRPTPVDSWECASGLSNSRCAPPGEDPPDRVWPICGQRQRAAGKPETFNFLGFTLICGTSGTGRFRLQRKTRRDRMRQSSRRSRRLRRRMHQSIPEQGHWLRQVVTGYFAYHAVPTNAGAQSLPASRHRPLAAGAPAPQSKGRNDVEADDEMPTHFSPPRSFIPGRTALRRQTPKVGAECQLGTPGSVRGDASNGIPTAILWDSSRASFSRRSQAITPNPISRSLTRSASSRPCWICPSSCRCSAV